MSAHPKTEEKYWIKNGMIVRHEVHGPVEVLQIETTIKKRKDGSQRPFLVGIHCRWKDPATGDERRDMFHSSTLKPMTE